VNPGLATAVVPAGPITILSGKSPILAAAVSGGSGGPYGYQWFLNGVPIPGANAATYAATVAGGYSVLSSDTASCSNLSNITLLTVDPPIVATVTPAGPTTFCASSNVTLNASASGGTGTFRTWQWYRNGVAIKGATSSLYVAWSPGSYTVAARDSAGFVNTSPPTAVTVTGR
jgi:hypothetical protein